MNVGGLREIITEQNEYFRDASEALILRTKLHEIHQFVDTKHAVVISGIRRCGKSTLLQQLARQHYKENEYYYLSFEDERLLNFDVADFNKLHETFIELMGERKIFFLDEIQIVTKWESFVRRMIDKGYKFYITGSNASLLSREIGTKLTGRHHSVELYPFSLREFLRFNQYEIGEKDLLRIQHRGKVRKLFRKFVQLGGMPEYLKVEQRDMLKNIYDDILYRDIVTRYNIGDVTLLRELSLFLISNIGNRISYNKTKTIFKLGSVNTIKKYVGYLEDCYLLTTLNQFDYSIKKQLIAPKKIYCIDNGIANSISFKFSSNMGHYLENVVAVELKRRGTDIFYYESKSGKEVDFLVRKGSSCDQLIQVSQTLSEAQVKQREVNALLEAMDELNMKKSLILTEDEEGEIRQDGKTIKVIPIYHWLLG